MSSRNAFAKVEFFFELRKRIYVFFAYLCKKYNEMGKVIGIGNALVDALVRLRDEETLARLGLPKGGMQLIDDQQYDTLSVKMRQLSPARATGGSAGNAMLALARLGAEVAFIGRIGDDDTGRFLRTTYDGAGIDSRLIVTQGRTGVANTFITPDGERTFATFLGVAGLTADDVTPDLFRDGQLLHIEGYLVQNHKMIERVCQLAKETGLKTSIDLASYNVVSENLDFFRSLVREYIDVVFANEEESQAFTSGKGPSEALEEIASMCEVAVVKLGKRGSSAMCGDERVFAPGRTVGVVDTTAAGDFFAGGFLYGLSCGASLQRCLETGALLSSHIIQVVGTRLSDAAWEEIKATVNANLNNN